MERGAHSTAEEERSCSCGPHLRIRYCSVLYVMPSSLAAGSSLPCDGGEEDATTHETVPLDARTGGKRRTALEKGASLSIQRTWKEPVETRRDTGLNAIQTPV